jgi:hypothetical protein
LFSDGGLVKTSSEDECVVLVETVLI